MISRRALCGLTAATLMGLPPRLAIGGEQSSRVQTRHGPVSGSREGGLHVFRGLRYGADTRNLRFQAPRPPDAWTRPADALTYGPASPQTGNEPDQSEDCLFLNVWTPAPDHAARPVMVYIHGGAYATGSGSSLLTDGARLAARGDVVVVTVNHRLGPLGYAYLARLDSQFPHSGNAGQLDLVLALQWVRDNIAAFGGDPGCVMLFGQSGGGAKIATLMATPAAQGLFHRAATMSGQQVTASGPLNATRRTRAWLDALGLTPAEAAHAPVERLLEAARARDPVLGYGSLYFGPVVDQVVLPRHPFYPDAPAQSAHIPMMIGNTREETLAFLGNDLANVDLTWETLPGRMTPDVLRIDIAPETVIAEYRRIRPDWTPDQVLIGATTAGRSWRAAVIEAELRAGQGSPAFVYQLDFASSMPGGRSGAFHTSDIPLVFDNVAAAAPGLDPVTGQRVADLMSDAFIAFARTGDPNHPGVPTWTPYGLDRRQTMLFDLVPGMADDPRGDERQFFAQVPYVQPGT